jgi:hypothetical protein
MTQKETELKLALKNAKLVRKQANADVRAIEDQLTEVTMGKLDQAVKAGILTRVPSKWTGHPDEYINKYFHIYVRAGQIKITFNHDNFDYQTIRAMGWNNLVYITLKTFVQRSKKSDPALYALSSQIMSYVK